jgi:hypothetical protein
MTILEHYENGDLISIKDNLQYNNLKDKPEVYGTRSTNIYFKMKLVDLVKLPDNQFEYIIFKTEERIQDKFIHSIMVGPSTFDLIYDYDVGMVTKMKNHFSNINRFAIDYGYSSLSDFLSQYNSALEKYPERMV